MTKNLTKTILGDPDSIIKYNIKQLMYYLNKNQVLRQILVLKQNLIKEKFDVKAEVEKEDNIIEQNIIEKDEFNDENEDETSLEYNMQVSNEGKLNVKDFNVEEGVLRKEAHYLVQKQLRARRNAFSSITPIWKCTLATWSSIESST